LVASANEAIYNKSPFEAPTSMSGRSGTFTQRFQRLFGDLGAVWMGPSTAVAKDGPKFILVLVIVV
jgi:hypothetical protein